MKRRQAVFYFVSIILLFFWEANPSAAQILHLNRENSGFIDNYVNRIALFNGLPIICTDSGVAIIHPDHLETWKRGDAGFPDSGARDATVHAGRLWIGTYGKGLARLDDGKWRGFSTENSGLINDFVTSLMVMGNRLFVGTRDGLCAFDGLLWEKIGLSSQPGILISAMAISGNILWVGTNRGLFRLENGASPVFMEFESISLIRVRALEVSGATLFVAHENGVIAILPDGSRKFWGPDKLPSSPIHGFATAENGVICSTGQGMYLLGSDGSSQKFAFKGLNPALPSASVLARIGGYFWVGIEGSGIVKIPESGETVRIPLGPGTPANSGQAANNAFSGGNSASIVPILVNDIKIFPPPNEEPRGVSSLPAGSGIQPATAAAPPGWSPTRLGAPGGPPPQPINAGSPIANSAAPGNLTPAGGNASRPPVAAPTGWTPVKLGGSTPPPSSGATVSQKATTGPTVLRLENEPKNRGPATDGQNAKSSKDGAFLVSGNPAGWSAGKIGGPTTGTQLNSSSAQPATVISFQKQIIPMLDRACVGCHTSGPGNYFPLNNLPAFANYLKTTGLARFEAATGQGRGMFNVSRNEDKDLLRAWLRNGAQD